jgi:hypothetical protein
MNSKKVFEGKLFVIRYGMKSLVVNPKIIYLHVSKRKQII